jgi:CubicO group peptidase (beta-lactamase class C family)
MAQSRSWLSWIFIPIGLLVAAIMGLWVFISVTAPVLHPNVQAIPSVTNAEPPQSAPSPAIDRARKIVRASLSEENLPGLSVAVGIGDDIVWAEGFGFADLKSGEPVTPKHRFRIGNISTALTSAAAGLLLEEGRLNLDKEIQTYVPEFPRKQWPVTLRELMGHTAGIVSDGGDEGTLFTKHCERPVEALPHFAESSLRFEPGTQYRFSNYDWILVSAAVEAAANQPFLTLMQERVFEPLGMRDTIPDSPPTEPDDDFPLFNLFLEKIFDPRTMRDKTPDPEKKTVHEQVTAYFPRFSADPKYGLHVMRPLDYSCYAGSSVFVSTPSDLVRFAMAIQSGKVLQPSTVQLLQTAQRLASGEETGYGLGWDLETVTVAGRQTRAIGHDGELLGGKSSSLLTFPEHGITVSLISNISYADTFSLAVKIADAFAQPASR